MSSVVHLSSRRFSLVLNYFLKGDEREKVRLTFFPSFGEDGF